MPNPKKGKDKSNKAGKVWICRPWITINGKRVYAREKGLKAFCFWVDDPNVKRAA